MKDEITNQKLRSFGFTVGSIFALIALWPVIIRAEDPHGWAVVVTICLLAPAVVFPRSLVWVYRGWMALGHVLGWINTRIILGFIFYFIVTPIGIIRRWLGKDPMGRRLRPDLDSYRVICNPRPASHLKKQY
jgi:O-antigen/teichoic acid export membrane protein